MIDFFVAVTTTFGNRPRADAAGIQRQILLQLTCTIRFLQRVVIATCSLQPTLLLLPVDEPQITSGPPLARVVARPSPLVVHHIDIASHHPSQPRSPPVPNQPLPCSICTEGVQA